MDWKLNNWAQVGFTTVLAVSLATGATYISKGSPAYILQGTVSVGPCDAGYCTGSFIGVANGVTQIYPDAAADGGSKPDAASSGRDASVHPDASSGGGLPIIGISEPPGAGGRVLQVAPLSVPAPLSSLVDPTFGVSARRLFANTAHDYSQLQAWSSDDAFILLIDRAAGLYDVYTWPGLVKKWRLAPATLTAPRWVPNSHTLVGYGGPTPARVNLFDVDSGVTQAAFTFPQPFYKGAIVQEEMDEAGQWVPAFVHGGADGRRHMVAVDIVNHATGADITVEGLFQANGGPCAPDPTYGIIEPNWVGIDPLGKYLLLGWARDGDASVRCSGLELFDVRSGAFAAHVFDGGFREERLEASANGSYVRHVYNGHSHGDSGVTPAGREFWLSNEDSTSNIMQFWYDGAPPTRLRPMDWGSLGHLSCRGPHAWCTISGYALGSDTYAGYQEVYLVSTVDGALQRLYHHRSTSCDYWQEPKSSASRDGKFVVFDSDWGACASGPSPYVIATDGLLRTPHPKVLSISFDARRVNTSVSRALAAEEAMSLMQEHERAVRLSRDPQ